MANPQATTMEQYWNNSFLDGANQSYLELQYEKFLQDPSLVTTDLKKFFTSIQTSPEVNHSEIRNFFKQQVRITSSVTPKVTNNHKQAQVHDLINGYRLFGHLYSKIDPIELREIKRIPELELDFYGLDSTDFDKEFDVGNYFAGPKIQSLRSVFSSLQSIYCGTYTAELMHISDSIERTWLQSKLEAGGGKIEINSEQQFHIMEGLVAAEGLEKYLASKYPGAKRFGLEGCDSFIVALDEVIQQAGAQGIQEIVIGMAHRGRLNVLVNIFGKVPLELFDEFEGKQSFEVESGDVKYHQGFSADISTNGGNVHLSLAFNPSHLEIVTPVLCGSVRARQDRRGNVGNSKVLPIAVHGDSAFSGQGVVLEILNMSQTRGYAIGGTIHIIINNQIGFTTSNPLDTRSTLYCSDIGKMLQIPIFHVNANDPQAVWAVSRLALEYRMQFKKDVIIDLIGYRRHGHNEADEPSATQPMMYKRIKKMPWVSKIYADKLIDEKSLSKQQIDEMIAKYRNSLDERDKKVARNLVGDGWKSSFTADWSPYDSRDWRAIVNNNHTLQQLQQLADKRDLIPDGMQLHPRVKKIIEDRQKMTKQEIAIDWGYAETLAYATLLVEGFKVRLSGQDCGRGTFFHRHVVWHSQQDGKTYVSLSNLDPNQGDFLVIDSVLSEAGVLGYEYGYSTSEPRSLVIWEAQFGDFANSAQVVIDQFISSGEQKWGRLSGLVMFLPHGYEGQGPEHSSARLERYLQLCAQYNIQVCVPSTPAQVYHMLRRQMLRSMRKPLIVMTPKSLLRHKLAVSSLEELANNQFLPIIADGTADQANVTRVILCSGKVYYEIFEKREELQLNNVAVIRVEQLYPFPEDELRVELAKYTKAKQVIWCQEEPLNQGAWYSSQHHMHACLANQQSLSYAGREASASPAVGYAHLHNLMQKQLVLDALGVK